ncbi:MAG: FecR family protein [Chitinophagales bacterium]
MVATPHDIEELFRKYLDNQCSPEEVSTLLAYFNNPDNEGQLRELIIVSLEATETEPDETQWQPATDKIFTSIKRQLQPEKGKIVPLFRRAWIRIAAAVILAIGIFFIYNYLNNPSTVKQEIAETEKANNEIVPGGNKAILTLANGSTVNLTTAGNDIIAQQGNTDIVRVAEGRLSYKSSNEQPTTGLYNRITTPRGGQYELTLSDGTMIWLNAASSIHFPVVFSGTERLVEITGEAYFEVAKNADMPFKVKVADKAEIEVLGTHFNIHAYNDCDEPTINTTLLEGRIKITGLVRKDSRTINPGEQAQLNANDQINVSKQADPEQVIAWKNGTFNFNTADLETALRELARWYDVDIVFEGSTPKKQFSGEMQRNLSISQVLKLLEKNGVNCRIEGKKLIVAK